MWIYLDNYLTNFRYFCYHYRLLILPKKRSNFLKFISKLHSQRKKAFFEETVRFVIKSEHFFCWLCLLMTGSQVFKFDIICQKFSRQAESYIYFILMFVRLISKRLIFWRLAIVSFSCNKDNVIT